MRKSSKVKHTDGTGKDKKSWIRPVEEITAAMETKIGYIRRSCRDFDEGRYEDGARLATTVSVICSDDGGMSLIYKLASKRNIQLEDSANTDIPGGITPCIPLLLISIDQRWPNYPPDLVRGSSPTTKARFVDWWERTKIYDGKDGHTLTRRQLTRALRNEDGGAHFEDKLTDPAYAALSRYGAGWVMVSGAKTVEHLRNAHFCMMRHIAWELECTLANAGLIRGPAQTGGGPLG